MICLTAATRFEMQAFHDAASASSDFVSLITGMGPTLSGITVTKWLGMQKQLPSCVVNFGVAGAYYQAEAEREAALLDICLAKQEILGDFGICHDGAIEYFTNPKLAAENTVCLDEQLIAVAITRLQSRGPTALQGDFVTVNCASATRKRGDYLATQHCALCENMEGAAVALACRSFGVPCLEVRAISNMVGDRDKEEWQLEKACRKVGEAVAIIVPCLMDFFAGKG